MTNQFKRFIQVNIITNKISTFVNEEMEVSFSCKKTRSTVPNDLTITIKNLSNETRQLLNTVGAKIRLFVGYGNERVLLTEMDITRAVTTWNPPDSETEIECLDGFNALKNRKIQLSFRAGTTVRIVVNALVNKLGLPVRPYTVNLNKTLKAGYSHTGTAYQALTELLSEVGATWSIIDNTIVITKYGQGIGNIKLLITPENGLLAIPEKIDTTLTSERVQPKVLKEKVTKGVYYVAKRYHKKKKQQKKVEGQIYSVKRGRADKRANTIETVAILPTEEAKTTGYKITMLLRPELNPFDVIQLDSKFHKGIFVIDEIEHKGGNREEEFFTHATVYERKA